MTEASIALARAGVPIVIMPMPLMGTTAPMSVAARRVITMAEILSAVVLFQLAAPGCPWSRRPSRRWPTCAAALYLCGAPEADAGARLPRDVRALRAARHRARASAATASTPDYQEGAEGMASCVLGALSGADTLVGFGTFDGAQSTAWPRSCSTTTPMAAVRRLLGGAPSTTPAVAHRRHPRGRPRRAISRPPRDARAARSGGCRARRVSSRAARRRAETLVAEAADRAAGFSRPTNRDSWPMTCCAMRRR